MSKVMLTTFDNPFNPFTDFVDWFRFDEDKGYHSCAYLGRIARLSNELSDEEEDLEVERAIDEIIKYDFANRYRKVRDNNTFKAVDVAGEPEPVTTA